MPRFDCSSQNEGIPGFSLRHRAGYTLVESLLVIGIISVLFGLLLGAMMRVREAADRTTCRNRMGQLGLALHQYHDQNGRLPPGLHIKDRQHYFMSWLVHLLPGLGQEALFAEIQAAFLKNNSLFEVPPHTRRSMIIKDYLCPSESRVDTAGLGFDLVAFTHFLGVSGTNLWTLDGMLFRDSSVRMADVSDGSATTLVVGERPPSANGRLGWWYGGSGILETGSAEVVLGVRDYSYGHDGCWGGPYTFGQGASNNICDAFHFWSRHPGGAHFLFADGSVQFLSYSADSLIPALATRAGHEAVDLP